MLAPIPEQSGLAPRRVEDDVFEQTSLKGATPGRRRSSTWSISSSERAQERASDIHNRAHRKQRRRPAPPRRVVEGSDGSAKWVHEGFVARK